ncbi:MAG: dTDP-4-dehydrorhamnose reductase [Deltaproteobacteria bacterium]|nr:dTDP-4-dehydrorhamnose reductase [Deltaproteobacteria bacterium]
MRRVALIGAGGMLGRDLRNRLEGSYLCLPVAGRKDLDITRREEVLEWIGKARPDLLINAAAYTDVDGCESHRERAMAVNGEAPGNLAAGCAEVGARMIQISTDFVFDGTREGACREEDPTAPLSVYGLSKLSGEEHVARNLEDHLIVRTSWLYGAGGRNFVEAILAQAEKGGPLRVVRDQVGSPTYVPDLSGALLRLLPLDVRGIVHVSNSGSCSWYDFARKILALAGFRDVPIEPIPSESLDRPARRPANSLLSCERYRRITGEDLRSWEDGLKNYLDERGGGDGSK